MVTVRLTMPPAPTCLVALVLSLALTVPLAASDEAVPEIPVVAVTANGGGTSSLMPDWEEPQRPPTLGGREREAVLKRVSGGGSGGVPLPNDLQARGLAPTLSHLILTVRRPWFVQRGFLAGEGVARLDTRSALSFEADTPGRAIVGLNLQEGLTYLVDFLISGRGAGDYVLETSTGSTIFADDSGERTHVLVAIKAEESGWTEISLRRAAGDFDLHTVEVTLASGPAGEK